MSVKVNAIKRHSEIPMSTLCHHIAVWLVNLKFWCRQLTKKCCGNVYVLLTAVLFRRFIVNNNQPSLKRLSQAFVEAFNM